MFGASTPFGQPSTQSVFGQNNSTSNNPFAPKPFGSTSPFGSQTGGSMFGGTSTGIFGVAQSASPLGSTAFGASSSPAFGNSFGAASTPAFGNSSSSFGGNTGFGQKPAFGGFGSTSTQSSPFGSTLQQSQPASGSNLFGSSQPTFGATSSAFGSTNTPAFGAPSSPAFGATATNAFGATSTLFGGSGGAFGGAPAFGSVGGFGASGNSTFGVASAPAFGTTTSAFSASSSPAFSFGSTSAFNSSPFGTNGSSLGAQSSAFGAQSTTSGFGNGNFGQSRGGSRVASYTPTADADGANGAQAAGKLMSISAMPVYKEKSHEELRWEDLQLGDKGGPNPAGQSTNAIGFGTSTAQSSTFPSSLPFGQSSSNPFLSTTSSNIFAPANTGAASTSTFNTSHFAAPTPSNPFGQSSSSAPSIFATSTTFTPNPSPSIFGTSSSSSFGQSSSIFGSNPAQVSTTGFNNGFNVGVTQSSPLYQSTGPSPGQTSSFAQNTSAFGQNTSVFGQPSSTLGQQTSTFGQPTTSAFGPNPTPQTNLFSTPSTGFAAMGTSTQFPLSNTPGLGQTTSSTSTLFQSAQPAQTISTFGNYVNFGQTQAAATGYGAGSSGNFGQSHFGQMPTIQSTMVSQPAPMTNPYGVLPVMPQMSIDRARNSPSIQYGISSMPVIEKSAPVRISPLLTSRHFSQRRMRLPARSYHPKQDGQRVAFFDDDEETPITPKADALFTPRENPRSLVIRPKEQSSSRATAEKIIQIQEMVKPVCENGKNIGISLNGSNGEYKGSKEDFKGKNKVVNGLFEKSNHLSKLNGKTNGDHSLENGSSSILDGQRSGEARTDVDSLMPKLQRSDYYTEPRIEELAAKERVEPGFCRRVKNFVIGRHGYGSITFLGETNVQGLDLESIVQFSNREVIVYMDESKKPPVGEGLNKPAEVTLLNIKCVDKKTGIQYTEGPKIDKYKEMLKKKADAQGAEFVSYDPVQGEWKFRVSHF